MTEIKPSPRYAGKRVNLTVPLELYAEIERLAKKDMRPVSQMVVKLAEEAMAVRNEKSPSSLKGKEI